MERLDSACMARKIKSNSVPKTVKFATEKQKRKKNWQLIPAKLQQSSNCFLSFLSSLIKKSLVECAIKLGFDVN